MQVGKKLKEDRKKKGLTLKDLSERTGISISLLSNIERNVSSPTLANMNKIVSVLGTQIQDYLSEENKRLHILANPSDFHEVLRLKSGTVYDLALCGDKPYKCVRITIPSGNHIPEYSVGLPEGNFVFIHKGVLKLEVNGQTYVVQPSDVLFVPGGVPHTFYNESNEECVSFWFAVQPLSQDDRG
ncbi:MAG: helix-turn-helix transcriptional regulator [Bacillota bacterium]